MNKKTVCSVMVVFMLFAVSLFFVGGTYARYASEFSGDAKVDVAKWAVALKNGEQALEEEFELTLTPEENEFVLNGKIAPGVTASAKAEISLEGTEVAVDVFADYDETALLTAIKSALSDANITENDIEVSVTVAAAEEATNLQSDGVITGSGTKNSPYVIKLPSNKAFGATDKLAVSITVTWANVDEHSADDTKIGEGVDKLSDLKIPVKLYVVQHIKDVTYEPTD